MSDDQFQELKDQIAAGFKASDERFVNIGERFTRIDARFDKFDERFAKVDARLDKIDQRLAEHDKRFNQLDGRLNQHDKQIGELSDLIMKLYQYTESEFGKLRHEIDQRFTEVHERLDRIYSLVDEDLKRREADEHERLAVNRQLDRHEDWIGRASKRVGVSYGR
jgi:chromosome segregation ATPase